jgi:dUTP pyrophosphatase
MTCKIQITKLRPSAVMPRYMSDGAVGMDLSAAMERPAILISGERRMIGTGLAIAIPPGYEGQVRPRSGLVLKKGVGVANAPGTIDSDYRGEVMVLLINHNQAPIDSCKGDVCITPGQRIAQLVIAPVVRAELELVDALPGTERGAGGFGSTGE